MEPGLQRCSHAALVCCALLLPAALLRTLRVTPPLLPRLAPASGKVKSAWAFGGAFLQFSGNFPTSLVAETLLARVNGTVPAGTACLPVSVRRQLRREGRQGVRLVR